MLWYLPNGSGNVDCFPFRVHLSEGVLAYLRVVREEWRPMFVTTRSHWLYQVVSLSAGQMMGGVKMKCLLSSGCLCRRQSSTPSGPSSPAIVTLVQVNIPNDNRAAISLSVKKRNPVCAPFKSKKLVT